MSIIHGDIFFNIAIYVFKSRDRPTGIANIKVGLVERNIACKKNPQLVSLYHHSIYAYMLL